MDHFADRLAAAVAAKGNALCVGLDPRWESLPDSVRLRHADGTLAAVARAHEEFCARVLDVVAPLVPAVKPQAAFFEGCGPAGMIALQRLLERARRLGLITILDGKRNDIASTASAYADAAFAGTELGGMTRPVWDADALTVNAYLGRDALEPFIASARNRSAAYLCWKAHEQSGRACSRTSIAAANRCICAWRRRWARGAARTSAAAATATSRASSATHPADLVTVRKLVPEVWFLIPGFGAQGGAAADTAPAFRGDGLGAIVNSSRGITFPFKPSEPNWEAAIETAARDTIAALTAASRG